MASAQRRPSSINRRNFLDSSNTSWSVEERTRPDDTDEGFESVLVFHSTAAFRCVTRFPAAWADLSDQDLERLSWET
jgi:hypothetical protein